MGRLTIYIYMKVTFNFICFGLALVGKLIQLKMFCSFNLFYIFVII